MKSVYERAMDERQRAQDLQTAIKITDNMEKLFQNYKNSERRVIWELIQNAKDVSMNKNLKIKIELSKNHLKFSHNGFPFLLKHLTFLIEQTSSKERKIKQEEEIKEGLKISEEDIIKTTGKYGTGFMTTNLLSKKIQIEGVFNDEENKTFQKFNFILDRATEDVNKMVVKIKKAFDVFKSFKDKDKCPFLVNYVPGENCDTSFKYVFENDECKEAAVFSIKDLEINLPYVFSFLKELKEVVIINKIDDVKITYKKNKGKSFGQYSYLNIIKKNLEFIGLKKNETKDIYIVTCKNEQYINLAKEIFLKNENYFLKQKKNIPTFFVDFPLIGSEKFKFPFVIQNHNFNPDETRSLIILNEQSKVGRYNKILLKSLPELYKKLFEDLKNFNGVRFLVDINSNHDWFMKNIEMKIGTFLKSKNIIEVFDGSKTNFNNLICFDSNSLNNLMGRFLKNQILTSNEKISCYWKKILQSKFFIYSFRNYENSIFIIQNLKSFSNICKYFDNENECYKFLNEFYNLIYPYAIKNFTTKNIFPNKNGDLKKIKTTYNHNSELFQESNIPECLKDITKKYCEYDINNCIIDKNIKVFWSMKSKNIKFLIDIINNKLNDNYFSYKKKLAFEICKINLKNKEERRIFKLGKLFYESNFKKKIEIEQNYNSLWEKTDKIFISYLLNDVEQLNNLTNLNNRTGNGKKSIQILEGLFYYISFYGFKNRKIYPNINGNFKKLKDLYVFDIRNEIKTNFGRAPENLYDVLYNLLNIIDSNLTDKFINENFLNYTFKKFTLQNSFDKIDNFIKDNQQLDQNKLKKVINELSKLDEYKLIILKFPFYYMNRDNIFFKFMNEKNKKDVRKLLSSENGCKLIENINKLDENQKEEFLKIDGKKINFLKKINEMDYTDEEIIKILKEKNEDIKKLEELKKLKEDLKELKQKEKKLKEKEQILNKNQVEEFLAVRNITSSIQLNHYIKITNFNINNIIITKEKYEIIKKMLNRSVKNVIDYIKKQVNYNCEEISIVNTENLNILKGVKKNGVYIFILIRPTDYKWIQFHNYDEVNVLVREDSELWGDNGLIYRKLLLLVILLNVII